MVCWFVCLHPFFLSSYWLTKQPPNWPIIIERPYIENWRSNFVSPCFYIFIIQMLMWSLLQFFFRLTYSLFLFDFWNCVYTSIIQMLMYIVHILSVSNFVYQKALMLAFNTIFYYKIAFVNFTTHSNPKGYFVVKICV